MRLGIIMTAHCNATCAHCSKSYGPHRTEHLSLDEIQRMMNEAATVDDAEPLAFDLTGGEPFLNFDLLVDVVSHGSRLGAEVTCVTNASWARSDEIANSKLRRLKEFGLTWLSVSVSRFHQEFIRLERVQRALAAAARVGIKTELKGAFSKHDLEPGAALSAWKDKLQATRISIFPVLPYLREGEALPDEEYYRELGLPFQRCPGDMVCVDFDGLARSCCTLSHGNPFLVIGDARQTTIQQIHETLLHASKQRILRELGPIEFARGAIKAGLRARLRREYAGPCDLCLHIQSDPQLREVAEGMSEALDQEQRIF
jgi:hypothetical protein